MKKSCGIKWLSTIVSLNDLSRKPPDIGEKKFCHLLAGESHHAASQKKEPIISSFS